MYQTLTFYHSIVRWLLLAGLVYSIFRAFKGFRSKAAFSKMDNAARHWTATIAHVQLIIGILLYSKSPVIHYFWRNTKEAVQTLDTAFFGLIHILLMLTAIVLLTIGSALAKRKKDDRDKFKTMLTWFGLALIIILIAVPWPFSPFAQRPYLR
jgi:drug/metabolite transporter (DMT)-like permease